MANCWQVKDQVALKESPKWRGYVSQVLQPYEPDNLPMYLVRWNGFSQDYQYTGEMLISEKDANEIKARQESDGVLKKEKK